jgi:hypothetical protein
MSVPSCASTLEDRMLLPWRQQQLEIGPPANVLEKETVAGTLLEERRPAGSVDVALSVVLRSIRGRASDVISKVTSRKTARILPRHH